MKIFFALVLITSTTAFGKVSSIPWQNEIIKAADVLYSPVAAKTFQKKFSIEINEDATVAGSAIHEGELKIVLNTGLLNSSRLTPDSFRMIICHELGHLFGGAPRRNVPPEWEGPIANDGLSFMSSEGQADAYASLACFSRLLAISESSSEPKPDLKRAGPILKEKCRERYKSEEQKYNLCLRSALAGLDFLNLVFDFPITPEQIDNSVSPILVRDSYPERQCRLDTIINGALCGEDKELAFSFSNQNLNDCLKLKYRRPVCWFPVQN